MLLLISTRCELRNHVLMTMRWKKIIMEKTKKQATSFETFMKKQPYSYLRNYPIDCSWRVWKRFHLNFVKHLNDHSKNIFRAILFTFFHDIDNVLDCFRP